MTGLINKSDEHFTCDVSCDDCGRFIKTLKVKAAAHTRAVLVAKTSHSRWWCGSCWRKES